MAAVEVTISGVLYDKMMRTTRPVVLIGEASLTGLSVGGGPSPGGPPLGIWGGAPPYPDQGLPGQPPGIWPSPGHPDQGLPGQPPGIWGGAPSYPDQGLPGQPPYPSQGPGFPTAPIVLPPFTPGGPPVTIWPNPGHPEHPIVKPEPPPPPTGEPDEDGFVKPPPASGGWAYHEDYAWLFYPAGQAVPKG